MDLDKKELMFITKPNYSWTTTAEYYRLMLGGKCMSPKQNRLSHIDYPTISLNGHEIAKQDYQFLDDLVKANNLGNVEDVFTNFDNQFENVYVRLNDDRIYRLRITEMDLNKIPDSINNLDDIIHLYLLSNNLRSIPKLILPQLKVLSLSNNQLYSVDLVLPQLQDLDLVYNKLTSVELDLPQLRWLRLSNNKLTSVDCSKLPKLYYLDLQNNPNLNCKPYLDGLRQKGVDVYY